jgi:hypothetical protein
MHGPNILAATLSIPTSGSGFAHGNQWQYHSQSNRHSNVAVWTLLFDLLCYCPLLVTHIQNGKVGIGVNYNLVATHGTKNLDLVIARRLPGHAVRSGPATWKALATSAPYGIVLDPVQQALYATLPDAPALVPHNLPLLLGVEAKAAMTAHGKVWKSRLASELSDIHLTMRAATQHAIVSAYVLVNASATFVSPVLNKWAIPGPIPVQVSKHKPADAAKIVTAVQNLPRATAAHRVGFDAVGVTCIDLRNDGAPITVVTGSPSPPPGIVGNYDSYVIDLAQLYGTSFQHI